jgi:hypothetical protein
LAQKKQAAKARATPNDFPVSTLLHAFKIGESASIKFHQGVG